MIAVFFSIFLALNADAATQPQVALSTPPIQVVYPPENLTMPMASGEVIFGSVSNPKVPFRINKRTVKVHRQGGFIAFLPVSPGTFTFLCELDLPGGATTFARTINVLPPLSPSPASPTRIDPEARLPASDLELRPGDWLQVQFKGSPGGKAEFSIAGVKGWRPMMESNPTLGIYQGVYQVKLEDVLDHAEIEFRLSGTSRHAETAKAKGRLTVRDVPTVAVVRSSGAVSVKTGPGNGYLLFPPINTKFLVSGRQGSETRVQLSPDMTGWIENNSLALLPAGAAPPRAVLSTIKLTSTPDGSLVSLSLSDVIPFSVEESADLQTVSLRLYNTTGYTNWIVYDSSDTLVRQVRWRQEDTNTALVTFHLDPGHQLWGYDARWEGFSLRLELRKAPRFAAKGSVFKGLTLVVDPGHMPSAHGAVGPRGTLEMDANLAIARALEKLAAAEGAEVVMTRTSAADEVGLAERPKIAWERRGDLFISVHNNALGDGEDPFSRPRGYSIFYYHPHSFGLAAAVHRSYRKRVPLPDEELRYGNLLVARMTQMPAILTESAYVILPEHEALLTTPSFQRRLGRAILEGARAFLEDARVRQAKAPRPAVYAAPEPEPEPTLERASRTRAKAAEKPAKTPKRKTRKRP